MTHVVILVMFNNFCFLQLFLFLNVHVPES